MTSDAQWRHLCGYRPDPVATARIVSQLRTPRIPVRMLQQVTGQDTFLWLALLACKPSWRRGKQLIGDCVSWGAELAATMLQAVQVKLGTATWIEEVATESIYGLRVESDNGASWQDGWFGSAAAKALQDYGVVFRLDYSQQTGNKEHDMRSYSGDKAKQWGYYGCGGRADAGKLDAITKAHPAKDVTLIKSFDDLAAAIEHGCPVTVASDIGYGDMRRDSNGVVRIDGQWGHQMMFGGVRYQGSKRFARLFQSWGDSASGPDPGINDSCISACSWWVTEEDAMQQIRQEDTWAFSRLDGFDLPVPDWSDILI